MPLRASWLAAALVVAAGFAQAQSLPSGFHRTDPIAGRDLPTGVYFSHDGRVFVIEKSGSDRHPILLRTDSGSAIAGSALSVNAGDLEAADRYEAADYERVQVSLASGRQAFVYVQRDRIEE